MGKPGSYEWNLTLSFGAPTSAVEVGMGVGLDGNPVTVAGAEIAGVAAEDHDAADIAANTSMLPKKMPGVVVLGTARFLLSANTAAGKKLAVQANSKFAEAVVGQAICGITLEGGNAGDLVEGFIVSQRARVASAASANTNGADLATLETNVNTIKAALRAHGILAP